MNLSSLSQFALLLTAIAIIFTYIQPTLAKIKLLQDERAEYQDAEAKAADFNAQLSALLSKAQSFRRADIEALETYLPSQLDGVAVMADIEAIARRNNVQILELLAAETVNPNDDILLDDGVVKPSRVSFQDFEMSMTGDYDDLKAMFRDFERNKYLLEVVRLQFGVIEEGVSATLSNTNSEQGIYELTLRAYAFSLTTSRQDSE